MGWSPDLHIGDFRPWPDTVHVVRGKTGVMLRYVPERICFQVDVTADHSPYTSYMTACSLCGEMLAVEEFRAPNYCPNCGAKVVRYE